MVLLKRFDINKNFYQNLSKSKKTILKKENFLAKFKILKNYQNLFKA